MSNRPNDLKPVPSSTIISPGKHRIGSVLVEAWRFRHLCFWLAWRDVKARYSATYLGIFWVLLQPVALIAILSIALGYLARVPSEPGIPYSAFIVAGITLWTSFSNVTQAVASGLQTNAPLLSKVYCSKLAIILSAAGAPILGAFYMFVACALAALILVGTIQPQFPLALGFLVWAGLLGCGIGVLFAAINVRYHDAMLLLPILLQVGLFAGPVLYPSLLVPTAFIEFYSLNPTVGILGGFRWAIYGSGFPALTTMLSAAVGTILVWTAAIWCLSRVEHQVTDTL